MPFPDISPIAFQIGPLAVRWYALSYLFGIGLSVAYGTTLLRRKSLWAANSAPMNPAQLLDFAFWAVLAIVLGGRLGYVLLYNLPYYAANPLDVLRTWDGGMSFHGGFVGLMLAIALFARTRKLPLLPALDLLGAIVPLTILLVRVANFVNGELFGRETNLPWGVIFPDGGPLPRHPTQLYEAALEGAALFLALRLVTHLGYGLRRPGLTAGVFATGYALSRLAVETVRLPDPQIGYLYGGWLTLGMVYTVPLLAGGIGFIVFALRRKNVR